MKLLGTVVVAGLISLCGFLPAQERPARSKEPPKVRGDFAITAEREAAVMKFVEQNHVELKELLTHLRDNRVKDYERAIRDLFRESERIGQLKERDSKQYDLELKAWTIKSRIQLLTAHLAMGESEEIRTQLRGLIGEQIDVRTALLEHDRSRLQDRLAKMEQELARLQNDRQKIVENQLQLLTKSAADSKSKVKVTKKDGARPANRKPVKPTVNQPEK